MQASVLYKIAFGTKGRLEKISTILNFVKNTFLPTPTAYIRFAPDSLAVITTPSWPNPTKAWYNTPLRGY